MVGSLEYHRNGKKHKGKLCEEIRFKYHLPWLLARLVLEVTAVAAYKDRLGWRVVNLQAYRQVPTGEPIFVAAVVGNLERMRELLSTHGGYVNDRDVVGATPLHVSI
jgi:hypothetical protein